MNRDNCGIFSNKSGIINKISPKYQIRPQYDPKAGKFIHSEMIKRINKPIANKKCQLFYLVSVNIFYFLVFFVK